MCSASTSATTVTGERTPVGAPAFVGLKDRVETLGGSLAVRSPAGGGTTLDVELPLGD